jgi:hypothetical protein
MTMGQALYQLGENQALGIGPGLKVIKGLTSLMGPTASSAGSHACGDPSDGGTSLLARSTSHGSMKQEVAHRQ